MMTLRAALAVFVRFFAITGVMFLSGWKTPQQALESVTLYLAQPGTPAAIPNFVNPGAGCDWWGLGGQVFNQAGRPEPGFVVHITGVVDGVAISRRVVSGSSLAFGAGGFDLQVASYLPTSSALKLQLFDSAGRAQSGVVPLPHYRTCERNLLVINLRQRSFDELFYIPWIKF